MSAQRFPADFDGIIAGAPVLDETGTAALHLIWAGRANLDAAGAPILTPQRINELRSAVRSACDPLDGHTDGLIDDPRNCDWRAAVPACDEAEPTATCFSAAEISVLDALYEGARDSAGGAWCPAD